MFISIAYIYYLNPSSLLMVHHMSQVGKEALVPGADYALNSIHNIREAIPEIWECGKEDQIEQVLHPTGVETVVLA